MPMFKTIEGGLGDPSKGYGAAAVADYLNHGRTPTGDIADYLRNPKAGSRAASRVRGFAARNLDGADCESWARTMDETRKLWGKDSGRLWYHFVISPDPEDHVGTEEVLDIASEWLEQMYPRAQAAITIHDDNANGIPHAHIVVNSVYPDDGRKVWRSNEQIKWEARWAQIIGERHGLSVLPDIGEWRKQRATAQDERQTQAEDHMKREGRWSWKNDIRERIRATVQKCDSWAQFTDMMEAAGYGVTEGRRGVCFHHPLSSGHDMRVLGERLGAKWTKEALIEEMGASFSSAVGKGYEKEAMRERMRGRRIPYELLRNKAIRGPRPGLPWRLDDYLESAKHSRWRNRVEIRTILEALGTVKREKLASRSEVRARLDELAVDILGLEDRVHETEAKFKRAYDLLDKIDGLAGLQKQLDALPRGFWSISTRNERNRLESALEGQRKEVAEVLDQAAAWLSQEGYGDASDRQKAVHIIAFYRDRLSGEDAELEELTARAKAIQKVQEAIEMTAPRRCDDRSDYQRAQRADAPIPQEAIYAEAVRTSGAGARTGDPDGDEFLRSEGDVRRRRQEAERDIADIRETIRSKVRVDSEAAQQPHRAQHTPRM